MFNIVRGNVITHAIANKTNIAHGCNCFHTMGAGVAKAIKDKWPELYEIDLETLYGYKGKLGTVSYCALPEGIWGFNLYTQFNYGRGILFRTAWLASSLNRALYIIASTDGMPKSLSIPFIGAGLGGGDADEILSSIKECCAKYPSVDVTLVLL
jgi:O-acetyl-ADP-ribose deacetylase (regulator of RNase III)